MADFGSPVAQNVQGPSLSTLNDVINFKRGQQALQIGDQTLQQQQIDTQKKQIAFREQQALGRLDPKKYIGKDGVVDADSYARDALQAAPISGLGQERSQKMYEVRNSQLGVQKAAQSLNEEQRKDVSDRLESAVQNSDGHPIDLMKVAEAYKKENPGAAGVMDAVMSNVQDTDNWDQARQKVHTLNLALKGVGTPTVGTQYDKSGNLVGTAQSGLTGEISSKGKGVAVGLSPTEQLPYVRARGAAGTEGTQGAANDEALYNDIIQKGTKAASLKALTQDVRNLAGEVQTGQYSKAFSDRWSAIKQTFGVRPDDNSFETKRQILSKMAAQLRTQSEAGASTDAERSGIASALPDPEHMGPAAVDQAARYVGALADSNAARAKFANQHRQVNGGTSTGIRAADSAFMQNADPRVFEYQGIPAGKERQDYLKQHFKSKEEVQSFLDRQKAMRDYGAIQ